MGFWTGRYLAGGVLPERILNMPMLVAEDILLKDQQEPNVLLSDFTNKFNALSCVGTMDDYLDVHNSSPMGLYFMKTFPSTVKPSVMTCFLGPSRTTVVLATSTI